jgi:HEAT repeat protein
MKHKEVTMSITLSDVRARLDPDEVDYSKARRLGPDALPFLMELVKGGDLNLASKAAYLASMISSDQSMAVLEAAAASKETVVRVAAASGIRNLLEADAEKILKLMKNDPDSGVRKVVLKSVPNFRSPQLVAKVQEMAEKDPEPFVRDLAASTLKKLRRKRK